MCFSDVHSSSRCISCHGHGYKTCTVCHGSQNLLHFIQLTVTWYDKDRYFHPDIKIFYFILHICLSSRLCRKNNVEVFIPDRQPEFPDQKFETVTGNPLFVDESVLVKTKLFNLNYSVAHIIPAKRQCVSITIVVFPPSSSGVSSAGFPRSGNLQRLFKTD